MFVRDSNSGTIVLKAALISFIILSHLLIVKVEYFLQT